MNISWGKCRILYRPAGSASSVAFTEMPTPVEGTTQLNATQGEKVEAKVEGGENEAVKYKRNTYQLVFNVRVSPDRTAIANNDGVVDDEYEFLVLPEDKSALSLYVQKGVVNVQDGYNANDGGTWNYTVDAVKIDEASKKTNLTMNQVHWGVVTPNTVAGALLSAITTISFKEQGQSTAESLYQKTGGA